LLFFSLQGKICGSELLLTNKRVRREGGKGGEGGKRFGLFFLHPFSPSPARRRTVREREKEPAVAAAAAAAARGFFFLPLFSSEGESIHDTIGGLLLQRNSYYSRSK
jgi:hypothetical protein